MTLRALLLLVAGLLVAACGDRAAEAPTDTAVAPDTSALAGVTTVRDVVATHPDLAALRALATRAGLDATLADTARALTLFAPTDAAVAAAGLDALPSGVLRARLLGHVLDTRLFSTDALGQMTVETAGGGEVMLDSGEGTMTVTAEGTTARIVTPDLDAENGVVHVVDAVLPAP